MNAPPTTTENAMHTLAALKTLTLAVTALAAGALAYGQPARADDVVVDGKIITAENYGATKGGQGRPGELLPAVMPTDQKDAQVKDAYGQFLGRPGGDKAQDFHRSGDVAGITDGTKSVNDRGGLVKQVYGDVLGRKTDGAPVDQKVTKLSSLSGLGSTQNLFANSRGGDHHAGTHAGGGGGGAGKAQLQDFHFSAKAGDGSVKPADQLSGGPKGEVQLLLPAVQKVRDAAARANVTPGAVKGITDGTSSTAINPGATKGLNFTNTARK